MTQKQDIIYFESVSDLYQSLGMPIEQDAQFTINNLLNIHREIPYKSPIFRANYYSFIFVKEGKGNYTTDANTFNYTSKALYFTNPGHLKAFEFLELQEGYLITLSEEFLKRNVKKGVFNDFPFLLSEIVPPRQLTDEEYNEFETLYLQIFKEYSKVSPYKYKIIGSLFVVLLLRIKELFWSNYYPLEEGDRSSHIVKNFKTALERYYRSLYEGIENKPMQVNDYAKKQNLNSAYFSQVIKSKTGRSVSTWISEKTITYAKSQLKNSTFSIKEICYQLGFSEPAYFSNFFKKKTGVSPTKYRKLMRK
ncbi:AraC family transcriptional regulator [Galbibacter pacificus]|uniref:AraC family transcriptional regulator n=1 Tax=Galbibacter pacificus TaxID=2996052 RepID=A0ABT6FRU4_9FLAO|nr:helix-turn-helix domain-containing protein [Galbibacter pacificus]MDG3582892.1 AraC family transcriptional regulator [Galbibacter pacificus]MDG3585989.1 AraC family transcriptional regulator [Galbibacter pacificus]